MRWHRRDELLPFGYRFTVLLWWTISLGASVITLGLFAVKTYEWITWSRVPMEPQIRFLLIFCPLLFVVLAILSELGWLSGTTVGTDRRNRGRVPSGRRRRSGRPPPSDVAARPRAKRA